MKPFSESCEQNKGPILEVLQDVFSDRQNVLEIASGTGQHAVFFGRALPHLTWQTSELAANHAGIRMWLDEAQLSNVLPPVEIDVSSAAWPVGSVDAIFNANKSNALRPSPLLGLAVLEKASEACRQSAYICVYQRPNS